MGKEYTIALKGDFRGKEKSRQLREILESKLNENLTTCYIDLSETRNLDFYTLTELLSLRNSFVESGSKLFLRNTPEKIRRLLKIFRVKVFPDS